MIGARQKHINPLIVRNRRRGIGMDEIIRKGYEWEKISQEEYRRDKYGE